MPQLSRALVAALLALIVDQGSKWWMLEVIDLDRIGRYEVAPPFLNFVMAWNPGINFGIFPTDSWIAKWALALLALVIGAMLVVWAWKGRDRLFAWGAGMVAGGALGNAYDRVTHGAVVDFLNTSCCGIRNPFAYNIADVAIFVGMAIVVWRSGKNDPPKPE